MTAFKQKMYLHDFQARLERQDIVCHHDKEQDSLKLTKREIDCIRLLAIGKSAKEIACYLRISHRTAEGYINNIKYKLQCFKQFQLGYYFGKYLEAFSSI